MSSISVPASARPGRKSDAAYLALSWIAGLGFGMVVYLGAGNSLSLLMRSTPFGAVSIVSLLTVSLFPFLITVFTVSLLPSALLPVCFGKAFLFSYSAMGLSRAFGSLGWLHCRMALFSDLALLPVLYFLWLRLLRGRKMGAVELFAALSWAVLVASIDYCIISPLWASLIEIQKGLMG